MRILTVLRNAGIALLFGASACASPTPAPAPGATAPAAESDKVRVVATFSVVGDLVQAVAKDRVELITLVGPESDAHDYEPTPSDVARVAEAQVIFEIGQGMESWLDALYRSSGSQARRVALSEGVTLRKMTHAHDALLEEVNDLLRIRNELNDELRSLKGQAAPVADDGGKKHEDDEVVEFQRAAESGQAERSIILGVQRTRRSGCRCG